MYPAASAMWGRTSSTPAGIHAWAGGAVGTMTLAVMTRASLGHTGNALVASRFTQAIYAAVLASALARIGAALAPASAMALLHAAAGLWICAFLGFGLAYGPILINGRPIQSTNAR